MRNGTNSRREACIVAIALLALLIASISTQAQRERFGPGHYEGENLVNSGKAQVNGGSVAAQPMSGFGSGWSGDSQLFWAGGQPGAVLDLILDVPAEGIYQIELHMTRAPDFGRLRIQVENKNTPERFDGYAATVVPSGPFSLGTFDLQAGPRKLSFMIDGKNERSTNYLAGIDFITLKKLPVAASQTQSALEPTPKWSITAMSIQPEPTAPGFGGKKAYKAGQLITIKCSYEPIVPGEARLRILETAGSFPNIQSWIKHDVAVTKAGSQTTSFAVGISGTHHVTCGVALYNTTKWTFPSDENWDYLDHGSFEFQVVEGIVPSETKWPTAPIIEEPVNGGKLIVKPRDSWASHCADGGSFLFEWQYLDKGFKTYEPSTWKPLKMMLQPLKCAVEGSTKDMSLKPGTYRVKAKENNGKYKFESEWSDWVEFQVPGN